MRGKINLLVFAGIAVLGIAFVCAAVLLAKGFRQFSADRGKAESMFRDLSKYYERNPFPSAGNVEVLEDNARQLDAWVKSLSLELKKGGIEASDPSPTRFMGRLGDTRNRLLAAARKRKVLVKDDFAFGFERYLAAGASALPVPNAVPDLTRQLALVRRICEIFFDSEIAALDAVRREDLETAVMAAAATGTVGSTRAQERAGPGGATAPQHPYTKTQIVAEFRASEAALVAALNAIARDPAIMVVAGISVVRDLPDVHEPAKPAVQVAGDGATNAASAGLPAVPVVQPERQERIVCGPLTERPARVRIEIDVYRFLGDVTGERP